MGKSLLSDGEEIFAGAADEEEWVEADTPSLWRVEADDAMVSALAGRAVHQRRWAYYGNIYLGGQILRN